MHFIIAENTQQIHNIQLHSYHKTRSRLESKQPIEGTQIRSKMETKQPIEGTQIRSKMETKQPINTTQTSSKIWIQQTHKCHGNVHQKYKGGERECTYHSLSKWRWVLLPAKWLHHATTRYPGTELLCCPPRAYHDGTSPVIQHGHGMRNHNAERERERDWA